MAFDYTVDLINDYKKKLDKFASDTGADKKFSSLLSNAGEKFKDLVGSERAEEAERLIRESMEALDDFSNGDKHKVMEGLLDASNKVKTAIKQNDKFGMWKFIAPLFPNDSKSDPIANMIKAVERALGELRDESFIEEFSSLRSRMGKMASPKESPEAEKMCEDFQQFIKKVGKYFNAQKLDAHSKDPEVYQVTKAMVVYCFSHACLKGILTSSICDFKENDLDPLPFTKMIETLDDSAQENLGFLSDEKYLGSAGKEGDGKLFKIHALREHSSAFKVVRRFRKAMGMSSIPSVEQLKKAINKEKQIKPRDLTKYKNPALKGDYHYFQFINDTALPVKVVCGREGNDPENLVFIEDIRKHSDYDRVTNEMQIGFKFGAGGYFVMYMDDELRDNDEALEGDVVVFGFGLYCEAPIPLRKARYIKLQNRAGKLGVDLGRKCFDTVKDAEDDTQHIWKHKRKTYVACGQVLEGEKNCYTWRITVQDFSSEEIKYM